MMLVVNMLIIITVLSGAKRRIKSKNNIANNRNPKWNFQGLLIVLCLFNIAWVNQSTQMQRLHVKAAVPFLFGGLINSARVPDDTLERPLGVLNMLATVSEGKMAKNHCNEIVNLITD